MDGCIRPGDESQAITAGFMNIDENNWAAHREISEKI